MAEIIKLTPDGTTYSCKVVLKEDVDKKYIDTIWKSKVFENRLIRVHNYYISDMEDSAGDIMYEDNGTFYLRPVEEIEQLYEFLGKAKYSKQELETMKLELKDV